jgi:hypothetical protein
MGAHSSGGLYGGNGEVRACVALVIAGGGCGGCSCVLCRPFLGAGAGDERRQKRVEQARRGKGAQLPGES